MSVILHGAIRDLRKAHKNLALGILYNVAQNAVMLGVFFGISRLMGSMATAVRGDLLVYLMTGIFLYMIHVKTVTAVISADGVHQGAGRMRVTPQLFSIASAALSSLYIQVVSAAIMVFIYDELVSDIGVRDWTGTLGMAGLAWVFGIGVGGILVLVRAVHPGAIGLVTQLYMRISMVTSGSMFVANSLPFAVIPWMAWNPMFHIVDQARGAAFINYTPHHSAVLFPVLAVMITLVAGLICQEWTQKRTSASQFSAR